MRERSVRFLEALHAGAQARGVDSVIMGRYAPRQRAALVLYGLGGCDRLPHARLHMRHGGRLLAWDAGYWERKAEDRKFRVSFDGFHSPELMIRGENPGSDRWQKSGLNILDKSHPNGHIVLVGNGAKSSAVGAEGWAFAKSREIRALHPRRPIVYRPKRGFMERGIIRDGVAADQPIEAVLSQASLVVCRHSNVAVDACRHGVPVVCDDGAASAIYPARLEDEKKQPSLALRTEFLHRLAWWQWNTAEAERGEPWPWIKEQLA